jgi:hypothetical protein
MKNGNPSFATEDVGLFTTAKGVTILRYAKASNAHFVVVNDGTKVRTLKIPDAKFTATFKALPNSVITAAHLFLNTPNNLPVTTEARQQLELISSNKELTMREAVAEKTAKKTAKFVSTAPAAEKATKAKGKVPAAKEESNGEAKIGVPRNYVLVQTEPDEGVKITDHIQAGLDLFKKTKGRFTRAQLVAAMEEAFPDGDPEVEAAKTKRRMVRKGFAEVEGGEAEEES